MAKPQLDLIIKQKLIENNTRNLERANAALKLTLAELAYLEAEEAKTPGAYTGALNKIRAKRDRQHANAKATEAYLNSLKS